MNETGLSMISGREWKIGEEVTVAFRMDAQRPPLQVRAAVRHTTARKGNKPVSTGVQFLSIGRADRLEIVGYLSDRSGR